MGIFRIKNAKCLRYMNTNKYGNFEIHVRAPLIIAFDDL